MTSCRRIALACAALAAAGCNAPYDYDVPIVHPDTDTATEDTAADDGSDSWDGLDAPDVPDALDVPDVEEDEDVPETDVATDDACTPECSGMECGPDPACGTSCGTCGPAFECGASGQCEPRWVTILAGTFAMGSPGGEPGRDSDETEHTVTLTRDFLMQASEVTQDQFEALMGYDPSSFAACGGDCPVEHVNWHEAAAYANAVSASAGLSACYACSGSGTSVTCAPSGAYATPYDCPGYRLPTEAEWERAARAGTTGATYNGTSALMGCESPNAVLDPIAWFCGDSGSTPHPVGAKDPNASGLLDMLGNVWEWCHDWYGTFPGTVSDPWGDPTGTYRVVHGGSWDRDAGDTRAAWRDYFDPVDRNGDGGFRLARSLP